MSVESYELNQSSELESSYLALNFIFYALKIIYMVSNVVIGV
jgi:hypothetical protein